MVQPPDRKDKKNQLFISIVYMYLTFFFNEDGEFVHFNDFNVNLPYAVILGLKRVLCLFVNNVNEWDKALQFFFYQSPLPTCLKSTRKYLYIVFISSCNTCTCVKHEE